jgi:hypothetical protein
MLFKKYRHSRVAPKINIMGAARIWKFKFLLPELSQIIFSPGPLIFKLRKSLKIIAKKIIYY